MTKWLRRLLRLLPVAIFMILAAGAAVLVLGRVERTVDARGEIRVERYQVVRPAVSGIVVEVLVAPGDQVSVGQVVARLRDAELRRQRLSVRQQLREARARITALRRERDLLNHQRHPLELTQKRREIERLHIEADLSASQVREREIRVEAASKALERSEELREAGLLSEQGLQEAQFGKLALEQQLERGQLEENLTRASLPALDGELRLLAVEQRQALGRMDGDIAELEERIRRWAGELGQLKQLTAAHEIRAGMDGVVLGTPVNDLLGRRVEAGDELLSIIDTKEIFFVTEMPEQAIVRVRSGQIAQVEITGLPKQRFDIFWGQVGKVSQAPMATVVDGAILYPVEIQLHKPWVELAEGRFYLRNGMRGQAKIAYQHNVSFARVIYDVLVGEPKPPPKLDETNVSEASSQSAAR
jgi:multidrug resistance efflux pump